MPEKGPHVEIGQPGNDAPKWSVPIDLETGWERGQGIQPWRILRVWSTTALIWTPEADTEHSARPRDRRNRVKEQTP